MNTPIQSIMDSFRRITRALRSASRASEETLGLSVAQLFVLQQLGKHASLSLNELAEHTYSHQSTVSVVVDELARRGIIQKAPCNEDRRRLTLQLTASGTAILKKKTKTIQERFASALDRMEAGEKQQLARLLELFVSHAGLAKETPHFFFEKEGKKSSRKRRIRQPKGN
jgi:DNA-binding MarR family transcriptional regulator